MKIICKHCKNAQEYNPRDPKKIPKYPHTKCSNSKCNKDIAIKRTKLINFDHSRKNSRFETFKRKSPKKKKKVKHYKKKQSTLNTWGFQHEKFPNFGNFKILELLGEGMYAEEISQKYGVSKVRLSRAIASFKKRNLIEQIQAFPKMFQLTKIGTLILGQEDLDQKRISEFTTGKRKSPKTLIPVRMHSDRFKNELIQKPSWLNKIRDRGIAYGLTIKRIKMKNWTKFLVFLNYQDFEGLDNIEICNEVVIYNFKRKLGDQLLHNNEELDQHINTLIENCKKARVFLQQKGFLIGQEEPVRAQRIHGAIPANKEDPLHIAHLGKDLNLTIKNLNESLIIDDSPDIGGEEETDNMQKVRSYFDIPKEVEVIKKAYLEVNQKINEINEKVVQAITKADLNIINSKIKETNEGVMELAKGVKAMAKAMTLLTNQPAQETKENAEAGGMYQ